MKVLAVGFGSFKCHVRDVLSLSWPLYFLFSVCGLCSVCWWLVMWEFSMQIKSRKIIICNSVCKQNSDVITFSSILHSTVKENEGYTLTGHFIRYTLLVPGWTPFAFKTALILRGIDSTRCWKHSSDILVHIDMIASHSCCRFVGCTSMMRISRSTTSQMCSIGLRSGDCGGYLSKVNSLSCSRNQSEMIWAFWHGALSCWK